jgi:hypothetical protein
MKIALALALQRGLEAGGRYGFLGIQGFAGIIVGVIILIFLCLILFKLTGLVAAKLGADAVTQQIIFWLLVLLVFVLFLHLFGLY